MTLYIEINKLKEKFHIFTNLELLNYIKYGILIIKINIFYKYKLNIFQKIKFFYLDLFLNKYNKNYTFFRLNKILQIYLIFKSYTIQIEKIIFVSI